nr:MAG TPA: putative coiled-coil protein [Caudoviricetes sp.]
MALGASAIIKHIQEQKELINTTAENARTAANEVQSATESLKNLTSEYENLGDRGSWDSDDYAQARDIQEEIIDLLKQQAGFDESKLNNIDLQNGKYEDQKKVLEDITAEQLRASKYALVENVTAQGNKLKETAKKAKSTTLLTDPTDEAIGVLGKAGYGSFNGDTNQFSFGSYNPKDINSILDYYDRLDAASKLLIDNMGSEKVASSGLYQWIIKTRDCLKDEVDAYRESTDAVEDNELAQRKLETARALTSTNARALNGALATLQSTIDGFDASKLVDLLNGINVELLTPDQQAALDKIREFMTVKGFTTEQIQAFVDVLVEIGRVSPSAADGVQSAAEAAQAAAEAFDDANKRIDNLQNAYQTMSTCVDEYNKNGWVTVDNLQALSQLEPQYLACLVKRDGQMSINTESVQKLAEAEIDLYRVSLLNNTIQGILATTSVEKANQILGQAKSDMSQSKQMLRDAKKQALQEAYEKYGSGDEFYAIRKAINQQIDSWENLDELWLDLKDKDPSTYLDKTSSASKSTSKSVSDAASAFDTLVSAMKEYNQYGYVSANTAKSLAGLEDKYTACLTKQNGKLVLNTAKFKDYIKQQIVAANTADDDGKSAYELAKILSYLNDSVDSETISFEQLTDAIKGYGTAMDEAKEKTDAIKSAFSDLYDVGTQKKDNDFGFLDMDAIEKQYQAVRNLYENTDLFTNSKYASALNSETGEVDYNSDAFKQMFADHLKELAASARETGGAAGAYLAQGFEDAAAKIANNVMSIRECIDGIGSSLNYATDRIDHFQSGFSDISDIVTQYNTYGGLSIDNYQKLMSLDDDYIKCLSLEGNQLKFNTEAYKELFIAKLNAMIDEYDAADETKALAQRLRELRDAVIASGDGFTSAEDKAKNFETTLGNIKSLLSDLIGVFEKFNENKSNDLKIQGDAWIDVIDKRIDALNEENDAQERAIELAKLQDEYERAKANKTVHVYGGRGQGFVWKADENAVREAGQNLSDKQREYKKKDEIDRLNKLKDKVQEANSLIGTSWDDYQKKLKYTAEFEAMTFEQMEGHYDGFKNSILDNMRDIQSATNVSDAITNLEKLINTLKTLNDVITFFTSGGVSTDGGGIFGLFNQIKNIFTGESGNFDLGGGFKKMFDGAAKAVSDGWNWITGKNRKSFNDLISWNNAKLKIIGRDVSVGTRSIEGTSSNFFDRLLSATNGNLWDISGIFNSVSDAISGKTGNLFTDIIGFFTNGFSTANNVANGGLLNIVDTIGSMFGPIAAGAQSIGSAISSGVVSFFPSIFAGLGTLVTSVGGAMAAMMQAIAAALASIPVAGWIAAAAAVAGAVALIATIASIASNVSSTQVDEPTPAFQAKKYAKGTRGVKKGQIANVDEKGEELIVRNPDQGRMTYLEKGDGVIPAKETDNLMAIGANPEGWLAKGLAEMTGSAAAGAGMSAKGPNAQLSGAAAAAAAGVGSVFKDEYDEILGDTNEFMSGLSDIFKKSDNPIIAAIQSMFYFVNKTAYRMSTVGKINSSKTVTESTSNTKKAAQSQISSMTSNFESSWKSVAGELGLDTKDIEATSKKMSEKMNELVNNTFDALNENTGLSAEQVEDVTNTMFDSLQKIYTSGWNSLASTSGDMSEEIAKKLNASYKSSVDSTNKAMNEISKAFGHSWNKVGGGVKTLSTNVQKTMEQAWADTSKDTQKLMYDMRACFDNSWSMNEAGVTNLADMTQGVVKDGYAEIDSSSSDTFGENGQLKTDADNSWKNVEPGATNLANNMQWVMDQSYNAIKAGCEAAVTSIKNDLATTGDAFEAVATKAEKAKQETQTTTTPKTETKKETDWSGTAAGAVIGSAFGPFGSLIGAGIGYLIHHASGVKSAKFPHMANVDEQGPEMLVRKPDSGRYTYLETGDGVVPADITSKLFEMGGNPDAWFQKQMAKYGSQPIVQGGGGDVTTSIGDIIITNPVGSSDALANEIKQKLPTKVAQMQSKR